MEATDGRGGRGRGGGWRFQNNRGRGRGRGRGEGENQHDHHPQHRQGDQSGGQGEGGVGRMGGFGHYGRGGRRPNSRGVMYVPTGGTIGTPPPPPPPPQQPHQLDSAQVSDTPPIELFQVLALSSIPETKGRLPLKRPDDGGKSAAQLVEILVNHFRVTFNSEVHIFHYDVDIKPKIRPKYGGSFKLLKSDMCMIRNKLFGDDPVHFPLTKTAYDGERNIFSAVELPTGIFNVEVSKEDDLKTCTYIVTMNLVKKLELHKLVSYLNGNLPSVPREILQSMDLVMRESLTRDWISIGHNFYSREFDRDDDLGNGVVVSRGFQHSLKPTTQGVVLSLDISALPLRKPVPVLEYLKANLRMTFNVRDSLRNWEKENIEKALKNLRVTVNHRRTKQKYKIMGLTKNIARDIRFSLDDEEGTNQPRDIGLVDYFRNWYNKEIQYKNLPCLDFSKNKKMNYVPMEFCVLVEGQCYPKENLEVREAQYLRRRSVVEPYKRKQEILDIVNAEHGPCRGEVADNFGISVSTEMTEVTGRIIGAPALKVGDLKGKTKRFTINRDDCQWNLVGKSLLQGKQINRWAVLDFTSSSRFRLDFQHFNKRISDRCTELGMFMEKPILYEPSRMEILSDTIALRDLLRRISKRADQLARGGLQILLCVMTKKDPGYKNLKRVSETEIGILTQCCLVNNANKSDNQYLANMALKINAKLGGSNAELFDRLPGLKGDGHVMFVGADVNHPGAWNKSSPSIAAVVASINWPAANRYAARIRPQEHRKEKIQNFGEICLELLDTYARLNKVKPENIVVFRDGVSEGQFDMVLNEELTDLKNAICSGEYSPTITVVVAQKRHQTRLFPKDEKSGARTGNVFPGTVVDTTIVHPTDFDFYLCSHYGNLGTSKPTHYHVLYDEHGFTSEEMQTLIYNLCYTFARCTKPVSLVPPVYYADLAAYRGRLYHDALMDLQSPISATSSSSSFSLSPSSSSSVSSLSVFDDTRYFRLHNGLENVMFFC